MLAPRLLLAVLALLPAAAPAAGAALFDGAPLDFSLHLGRYETRLADARGMVDVTVKRAGVAAYANGDPRLQPGLLLGYAAVGGADAFAPGRESEGFFAGPALRSMLFGNAWLSASVGGVYLYQRVRDEEAGVSRVLEWQQWQLALDAALRLGTRTALLVGGHYGAVDAEQRLSGGLNETRSLNREPAFGARLGLEFSVDGDGRIGIAGERGALDGLDIYFQRQF